VARLRRMRRAGTRAASQVDVGLDALVRQADGTQNESAGIARRATPQSNQRLHMYRCDPARYVNHVSQPWAGAIMGRASLEGNG
jgi:hypothetical protein